MTERLAGSKRRRGLRSAVAIADNRPLWRPTRGSTRSSEQTRVAILWAAQRVLVTKGYAAFTTRAVATAAGIGPGTLAYHYKTKRELMRAVITALVEKYARQIDDFFNNSAPGQRQGFAELVAWLIHDSTTRHTSRLARELWAMALHDPFVAGALDGFYQLSIARIAESLRDANPGLSTKRATDIVYFLITVCEGSNPIFSTASRKDAQASRVTNLAIEALVRAVREGCDT